MKFTSGAETNVTIKYNKNKSYIVINSKMNIYF